MDFSFLLVLATTSCSEINKLNLTHQTCKKQYDYVGEFMHITSPSNMKSYLLLSILFMLLKVTKENEGGSQNYCHVIVIKYLFLMKIHLEVLFLFGLFIYAYVAYICLLRNF